MWIFRWWIFYPLAALAAALFIVASMGPGLIAAEPRPVFGRIEESALVLDGESLSHPRPSPDTVFHIARNARWAPVGLRVATLEGAGPIGAGQGLRIILAPERAAELAGRPLRVQVAIRSVPVTTAEALAVGVDRGAEVQWSTQPTTQLEGVLTYAFPAASGGPIAIALRPETTLTGYHYGVEIAAIRITAG
ncbi:MAG: hypothetical protein GC189_08425 [Alphaproteobacteria bacterium]|nr:hypothetical protein [Alphaproteobacteria bacterium]